MRCLLCRKNPAQKHPTYGILPCKSCQQEGIKSHKTTTYEFIPERIKEDRKANWDSIIQPYRGDTLSKEYLSKYGVKGINPTPEQIKKAKPVWTDHDAGSGKYYK